MLARRRARCLRPPTIRAWNSVEKYYFPLVGQVIRKPRWFAPAVDGVWVQAVHDGKSMAMRVTWDDRSQSPDTAWNQFTRRVLAFMHERRLGARPRGANGRTRWRSSSPSRFPKGPSGPTS